MSFRRKVCSSKCPSANCPFGKRSFGNMSFGKMSFGKVSFVGNPCRNIGFLVIWCTIASSQFARQDLEPFSSTSFAVNLPGGEHFYHSCTSFFRISIMFTAKWNGDSSANILGGTTRQVDGDQTTIWIPLVFKHFRLFCSKVSLIFASLCFLVCLSRQSSTKRVTSKSRFNSESIQQRSFYSLPGLTSNWIQLFNHAVFSRAFGEFIPKTLQPLNLLTSLSDRGSAAFGWLP